MYIYQRKRWPNFTWDQVNLSSLLTKVRHAQGRLLGQMEALGFALREEASLETLTQDVLKSSEIEGEKLSTEQVRSSIAKRLGINIGAMPKVDKDVEGIVEMMLDATGNYHAPLSKERLFNWHAALFPDGRSGLHKITTGTWRTKASGPMQVVSGPFGREKVHFEAPRSAQLNKEMTQFLKWFNAKPQTDLLIKSAIAHFWFVTIHPFEDGNGRIARAIADMVLAEADNTKQRFYSMSAQIQRERKAYYHILEQCQKDDLDITAWLEWYLLCLMQAITASHTMLNSVLTKAQFWRTYADISFNERQRNILNRLLEGFEGKLTSSKWAKITKCSQDTALRDITNLITRNILVKDDMGGRSTSYRLNLDSLK